MSQTNHWLTAIGGLSLLALSTQPAVAGSDTCPASQAPNGRIFGVTTSVGFDPTCLTFGDGNIEGGIYPPNNDQVINFDPTLSLIDKTPNDTGGLADGALTITGGSSGNWSIDATKVAGFNNLVLAIKVGEKLSPSWAAFTVPIDALSGTWYTDPTQGGGLSHGNLYGTPVPIPAAAWLFGSALVGGLGIGYRRKPKA